MRRDTFLKDILNRFSHKVLADTEKRVVVHFLKEEEVLIYDWDNKYKTYRPILRAYKLDTSEKHFLKQMKKLGQ